MDYKKIKAPTTTVTQNLMDFAEPTGNIYESVAIRLKSPASTSVWPNRP